MPLPDLTLSQRTQDIRSYNPDYIARNEASPLVSIIVLNWNGANILDRCLGAISAQTFRDFELIVVDNASTDRSIDGIESRWPGLRLLALDRNLDFAMANNRGAAIARGEWLAFLNNDAFPEAAWLAELVQATCDHPGYSFFSSKIVYADQPNQVQSSGDVYHISGFAWPRDNHQDAAQSQQVGDEVFSPCAAAAFYKRNAFVDVNGFDEDFCSHLEDVDLGFRLRLRGHRCRYVPQAVTAHIGSASYGLESDRAVYHVQRNVIWSFWANMPGYFFWLYLPIHLVTNLVFLIYYSTRGQFGPVWKAKRDAFAALPAILKKRKSVQSSRTVPPSEIRRVLNHHWLGPFILGKRSQKIRSLFGRGS